MVGFALYFISFSTFTGKRSVWLEDLFVRPVWRNRGVGRQLLAHVARVAVTRDCRRMKWWVLDWNMLAIEVCCAIGATPLDDRTIMRLTGDALRDLALGANAS